MIAVGLALRDFWRDRSAFLGLAVALAAVLGPLLVLLALKTGIIAGLLDQQRNDPEVLEIRFNADVTIRPEVYDQIAALEGVGFIAPQGRYTTETIELVAPDMRISPAVPLSSGAGDPDLLDNPVPGLREVVLGPQLAERLRLGAGDSVTAVLSNHASGAQFDVEMQVVGVSSRVTGRYFLADPDFTLAAQTVGGGFGVEALQIPGPPPPGGAADISRLRLYAKDILDVGPLDAALRDMGFYITSNRARIENILTLERNLGAVLWIIAGFAGTGYILALSLSLRANVERKRKSLAMLRLMGLTTPNMVVFPVVQALCLAALCCLLAFAISAGAGVVLNRAFADSLPGGGHVAMLHGRDIAMILLATAVASILSSAAGGIGIARLEPKEALRGA